MRQGQSYKGQSTEIRKIQTSVRHGQIDDIVLEKNIFNNIFEKDIRRVFIYKKAERLAKAVHLITPAFESSVSLKNRIDAIAIGLIDAAMLPPGAARAVLSHELLALSSFLSLARTSHLLSSMNAELITRETHALLQEIASYEEPRLSLDETPTLSVIAKNTLSQTMREESSHTPRRQQDRQIKTVYKGHLKDIEPTPEGRVKDRQQAILSVIGTKGIASIKDISTLVRGVSEKTIQRELMVLINTGKVLKKGERRWSTYSIA